MATKQLELTELGSRVFQRAARSTGKPAKAQPARKTGPTIALHPGTGTEIVKTVLRTLGANPVVITDVEAAHDVDLGGVLLLGGEDINPVWYGQERTYSRGGNRTRDAVEWILAKRALEREVPLMGICRGHQMLTAVCGGSLYQDILMEGAGTIEHTFQSHKLVDVLRPLAGHLPDRLGKVNSYHHQAVKRVPFGFDVAAVAPDGVIEAIWRPGILGVQWHPELLLGNGEHEWTRLFTWFLKGLE